MQQTELRRMHATGDYSIADLAALFTIGRATVYRCLQRASTSEKAGQPTLLGTSGQLREFRAVST